MPPVSNPSQSRWELYVTAAGNAVVQKELEKLGADVVAAMFELAVRYEVGDHASGEYDPLSGRSIAELRLALDGESYRLFFGTARDGTGVLVGVHAWHKKSSSGRRTPKHVLDKAERRWLAWLGK